MKIRMIEIQENRIKKKNSGVPESSDVKDKGKVDGKNNEKDNGVEDREAPEGTNA